MSGRKWTEEEICYVDEKRAYMTAQTMAKHLNRTAKSVHCLMHKMGWHSYKTESDWMTANQIYLTMGISKGKVLGKWKSNGLRVVDVGACHMIDQRNLIKYMESHQDDWDARKVKDDSIFTGQKWFYEKLNRDRHKDMPKHNESWTEQEIFSLKQMYAKGVPLRDISKTLGRTYPTVKQRLVLLRRDGWRI